LAAAPPSAKLLDPAAQAQTAEDGPLRDVHAGGPSIFQL
jgi:hypothetical protein